MNIIEANKRDLGLEVLKEGLKKGEIEKLKIKSYFCEIQKKEIKTDETFYTLRGFVLFESKMENWNLINIFSDKTRISLWISIFDKNPPLVEPYKSMFKKCVYVLTTAKK